MQNSGYKFLCNLTYEGSKDAISFALADKYVRSFTLHGNPG
jgi:hypothetical protein